MSKYVFVCSWLHHLAYIICVRSVEKYLLDRRQELNLVIICSIKSCWGALEKCVTESIPLIQWWQSPVLITLQISFDITNEASLHTCLCTSNFHLYFCQESIGFFCGRYCKFFLLLVSNSNWPWNYIQMLQRLCDF